MWPRSRALHGTHRQIIVYILEFCVWQHSIPCTLEINSNDGSKQGHMEVWVVTYHEGLQPIKSHHLLITLPFEITWQKNHYSSTIIVPVTTKLAIGVTYFQVLQTKKSYNALIMWSLLCHVTNENHYIFSTRVPMATKLGRLLSYLNGFPPIKSHHVKN